jgi:hypothetical protein
MAGVCGKCGKAAVEGDRDIEEAGAGLIEVPGVCLKLTGQAQFAAGQDRLDGAGGREDGRQRDGKIRYLDAGGLNLATEQGAAADLEGDGAGGGEGGILSGKAELGGEDKDSAAWIDPDGFGAEGEAPDLELSREASGREGGQAQAAVGQDAKLEGERGGEGEPERPAEEAAEKLRGGFQGAGTSRGP